MSNFEFLKVVSPVRRRFFRSLRLEHLTSRVLCLMRMVTMFIGILCQICVCMALNHWLKFKFGKFPSHLAPMTITQDKMEKPLMVRSRFRLVSFSSPVLLVLKCLSFFKMAGDESKINTSLSSLLTTSCSFQAFKNNSAREDVWTLIEDIEMISSFQFNLQLIFPQMRLVHKLLYFTLIIILN